MAKRWLRLQSNGQLSYSLQPNHKPRDTCSISSASIGLSELSRTMVIDTGVAVWKVGPIVIDPMHQLQLTASGMAFTLALSTTNRSNS